jgi:hypothetical protein
MTSMRMIAAWVIAVAVMTIGPPPSAAQFFDETASVRLHVTPKSAEVFIDGNYVGRVDDFDGYFERLRTERGERELTFYLPGFRPVRVKMFLQAFRSYDIHQTLQPLGTGERQAPRPGRTPESVATPPETPGSGTLALTVQPGNSEVWIDNEAWKGAGDDERLLVPLSAGAHRVEVRRDGYRSYAGEVTIRSGETATLNVALPRN